VEVVGIAVLLDRRRVLARVVERRQKPLVDFAVVERPATADDDALHQLDRPHLAGLAPAPELMRLHRELLCPVLALGDEPERLRLEALDDLPGLSTSMVAPYAAVRPAGTPRARLGAKGTAWGES
jgi:hypothetical protein